MDILEQETRVIKAPMYEVMQGQEVKKDDFIDFINFLDAKPKTVATYKRALKQFFKYLFENNISQPTRQNVIDFREDLKARCKPTTVQSYIIAVRLFFTWTAQAGIYPNVAEKIKGAKLNSEHKKDYLTPKQVKAVLNSINTETIQGKRDFAIFVLMVTCGLRTIEVSRANVEDLRILGEHTVLYVLGKGREERAEYIKVPEMTEKIIREYLKERENTTGKDPLFTSLSNNNQGQRISQRTVSGIIKEILKNAGYNSERLTAHSLRHTAVTLSLLGGNSLQEAQTFARHKNISTTQIYAHNIDKMKNKCSDTVAKAIF